MGSDFWMIVAAILLTVIMVGGYFMWGMRKQLHAHQDETDWLVGVMKSSALLADVVEGMILKGSLPDPLTVTDIVKIVNERDLHELARVVGMAEVVMVMQAHAKLRKSLGMDDTPFPTECPHCGETYNVRDTDQLMKHTHSEATVSHKLH